MLISLHLPKTAGSSFRVALEEQYSNGILLDYADLPINTPMFKRKMYALKMLASNGVRPPDHIECIHGHFLPFKYLLCRNVKFITWVRDPVERLGSHYYYWLRTYNADSPALQKRVIEEQWSLERFCLCDELKNFYSQFLWGFPLNRFDFIGITEYFELELGYFSEKFMRTKIQVHRLNVNKNKDKSSYFEDNELRTKIEQHHSKDVLLYRQALNIRLTRIGDRS